MQCTVMRSDGPWSCTISLNFLYDNKGNSLKSDREVSFPTIYDPKDVEIWLRRAQAAILMPRANPLDFHNKSVEELKGMQAGMIPFSWNKVEVLVRDPEGANLSFVDLPGKWHIRILPFLCVCSLAMMLPGQGSSSIIGRILRLYPSSRNLRNVLSRAGTLSSL